MTTEIEKLAQILKESNNIVFFGGAGVSTESHNKSHKIKKRLSKTPFYCLLFKY